MCCSSPRWSSPSLSSLGQIVLRVHVLFESSSGGVPHGCSVIRLLRPLSHPGVAGRIELSFGIGLPNHDFDVLIVERFWDHRFDWTRDEQMLRDVQARGARVIFELDDDLLALGAPDDASWQERKMWMRQMARRADGLLVSTERLAERMSNLNPKVSVVANALDDRLFADARRLPSRRMDDKVVLGYMGTYTHLEDLMSVLRPLRAVMQRHDARLEIIGIGDQRLISRLFDGLDAVVIEVPPRSGLYENFARFMLDQVHWDFGIAPLIDNRFSSSKSDIKYLDYAVKGIPGVFSDVPAYRDAISHRRNGLLARSPTDWEAALEEMITNPGSRRAMAREAHAHVWRERMLDSRATDWADAIEELAAA